MYCKISLCIYAFLESEALLFFFEVKFFRLKKFTKIEMRIINLFLHLILFNFFHFKKNISAKELFIFTFD